MKKLPLFLAASDSEFDEFGLFSGVPILRDVANSWIGGNEYRPTPAVAIYDAVKNAKTDLIII